MAQTKSTWRQFLLALLLGGFSVPSFAEVKLGNTALKKDGVAAPFLFGAEVQYFRARGGPGRNVPKAVVERLWDKLLDRAQEAKMNTVIFYIPWDFHEPVEGVFDFTGSLDQDKDGLADYPSRDIRGFLNKVKERGFQHVMVRPGPYINAEWGPEGFGAVPLWFLNNYPEALAQTQSSGKPRVASFAHPIYRDRIKRWFAALHTQVLKDFIGPGQPISFLQIDNETNYFWDSAYERDLSPLGLSRYRQFLQRRYDGHIKKLNSAYGSTVERFEAVEPPKAASDKKYPYGAWHYDWYLWHDDEVRDYYVFLRSQWESLGVKEPEVLFTRCDSFNSHNNALLPRLDYGQDGGLSLSTLNIYPKTFGTQAQSTLNTPMKAAHDAALLLASHRQYYGTAGEWLMSSETVGGWFPPTEVSIATRQHTYASLLGNGVKAMIIYYFHEGWNWDGLEGNDSTLSFDAPLDKDMNPRPSFALLKNFGESLADDYGETLLSARTVTSPVLIAHDSNAQYPWPDQPSALNLASTESAALFGLFRAAGALPEVGFIERMSPFELASYNLLVWLHPGYLPSKAQKQLQTYLNFGGKLLLIGVKADDLSLTPRFLGQIISTPTNPAEGWNSEDYQRLAKAPADLSMIKTILRWAHVKSALQIEADGKEAWIHGWLQKSTDEVPKLLYLYLENFTRSPQKILVKLAASQLPVGQSFKFQFLSRLSANTLDKETQTRDSKSNTTQAVDSIHVTREQLLRDGVKIDAPADEVSVWSVQVER